MIDWEGSDDYMNERGSNERTAATPRSDGLFESRREQRARAARGGWQRPRELRISQSVGQREEERERPLTQTCLPPAYVTVVWTHSDVMIVGESPSVVECSASQFQRDMHVDLQYKPDIKQPLVQKEKVFLCDIFLYPIHTLDNLDDSIFTCGKQV